MRSLFDHNSKFWKKMGKLGDLIEINILFLAGCLPLVTAGASAAAAYSVLFQMRQGSVPEIRQEFWSAFRKRLKPAVCLWIGYLMFLGVCILNLHTVSGNGMPGKRMLMVLVGAAAAILTMVMLYTFPMLACFQYSTAETLIRALLAGAGGHIYTIIMLLAGGVCVILTFSSMTAMMISCGLWLLVGFAALFYFNSGLMLKVFETISRNGIFEELTEEGAE